MIEVLCVDDDPDFLEFAKWFIEKSGTLSITTANSVEDALGIMEQRSFDAIVSDSQMPVTDGIEFPNTLHRRRNDIPFIIFTGKGREEVAIQAYDSGADFSIQKGGDPATQFRELSHKIVKAVRIHAAEAAFRESEERFRCVVENMTEGIVVIQDGLIRYANPALASMLQATPGDVTGTRFDSFIYADDRVPVVSWCRELEEGKEFPGTRDFRVVGNGGRVTWVQASAVRIPWNRRPAFLGLLADITERKVRENGCREENPALARDAREKAARLEESEREKERHKRLVSTGNPDR
ncbi:MAG: response regulator [Methanolinea sp.]